MQYNNSNENEMTKVFSEIYHLKRLYVEVNLREGRWRFFEDYKFDFESGLFFYSINIPICSFPSQISFRSVQIY